MGDQTAPDRLDGWGEIAAALKRDTRTVQRWEKLEGLPVHRHPGPKPRVWALRSEIQAWWEAKEGHDTEIEPEHPPLPVRQSKARHWIAALILVAFAVAIALF